MTKVWQPRPYQQAAIEQIVEAFRRVPVVVLDAPTGVGKGFIAKEVGTRLGGSTCYVSGVTKSLQAQFMRDHGPDAGGLACEIKGRANYPTPFGPEGATAEDCLLQGKIKHCSHCCDAHPRDRDEPLPEWGCPYKVAKRAALRSPLAVANTAYFLTETNFVGEFSEHFDLITLDECDQVASALISHVAIKISAKYFDPAGAGLPFAPPLIDDPRASAAEKIAQESPQYAAWAQRALPALEAWIAREERELAAWLDVEEAPIFAVRRLREFRAAERLAERLAELPLALDRREWICSSDDPLTFQPVSAQSVANEYLWPHGTKWLLMSATVLDPEELLNELACPLKWESVAVASPFPAANRPIRYWPAGDLSYKLLSNPQTKDEAYRGMAKQIGAILTKPNLVGERALVHTVSYKHAEEIRNRLPVEVARRCLIYQDAGSREETLQRYLETPAAILLAASMEFGIDLPGDACRACIIAKIPFPALGDRQVAARHAWADGDRWYRTQTVRRLVQMSGRGVRSADDWCETYILESMFLWTVWTKSYRLFPGWWREAIIDPERRLRRAPTPSDFGL